MYSEQIENLINHALVDGELTETEKQVLLKKAEEEGIDLAEFEMVLNAKLYERKQSQAKTATPTVTAPNQQQFSMNETNINTINDKPGIGWQILAFLPYQLGDRISPPPASYHEWIFCSKCCSAQPGPSFCKCGHAENID
jgi:hypothetical protein